MSKEVKNSNTNEIVWYNNPNIVTSFIIGLIALIVLLSQSFAIKNNLSPTSMLGSILNHNIMYLLVCIYFIALKTKIGKKYFDFLNIFLILLYSLSSITSLLTVFQSFGLSSLLGFGIDILILIYLFHTLLRSTGIWKSANLGSSPFNEITNNGYYSTILVLAIILLAVDLVSSTSLDGTILTILDTIYVGLFIRYVFLYGEFLNNKKISVNNEGNFDEIKGMISDNVNNFVEAHELDVKYEAAKEKVSEFSEDVKEKAIDLKEDFKEMLDKAELDEKVDKAKDAVSDAYNDLKENVVELKDNLVKKYEDSDLDEKVDKAKEVVSNLYNDVKQEATELKKSIDKKLDETDIDETIKEFVDDLGDKVVDVKNKIVEKYEDSVLEEKVDEIKTKTKQTVREKSSSKPKSEITSRKKNTKKSSKSTTKKSSNKKVSK